MGKRPLAPFYNPDDDAYGDVLEHIRRGTRQQYESDWTSIADSDDESFTHELGEVPWLVDVLMADDSEGYNAVNGNASVTVAKTDTTITVTSSAGATKYFQVRAM